MPHNSTVGDRVWFTLQELTYLQDFVRRGELNGLSEADGDALIPVLEKLKAPWKTGIPEPCSSEDLAMLTRLSTAARSHSNPALQDVVHRILKALDEAADNNISRRRIEAR